jgi:hypothetical protein
MADRARRRLAQEGNVTLITAFTVLLMVMVVLFATGIGQTASDATNMQSASDQAAITAATAFAQTFNDTTFLDALQWGVQALGNLGEAISIAGDALVLAGAFSLGTCVPCDVLGPVLQVVGNILSGIADAMAAVIDPFVAVVKQVLDVAKWVLGIANSIIIAGDNGYFGFMFPSVVGSSGPLLYSLQDVQMLAGVADAITSDAPDPSYSSGGANVSLKETLRRNALHTLWNDPRAQPIFNPPDTTLPAEPRGFDSFFIHDANAPGCSPSWTAVGTNPFAPGANTSKPPPVQRSCNERGYLKQLTDQPFLAEAAMLYRMKALIDGNPSAFDTSTGSLSDADNALDAAIQDLRSVYDGSPPANQQSCSPFFGSFCFGSGPAGPSTPVNYLFGTRFGAEDDQQWVDNTVGFFSSTSQGTPCSQNLVHDYVYTTGSPPATAYESFLDCNPASYTAQEGNPAQTVTHHEYWDGPADATPCSAPSPPSNCGHGDYRQTAAYKTSDLGDPQGLAKWIQANRFPTGHASPPPQGNEPGNPLMFLEVHEVQPNLQSQLAANLSGKADSGARWSFAISKVKIDQAKDSSDRISFAQFCTAIFGEPPSSTNFAGILTLPDNASGWCTLLANAVIDLAAAVGGLPDPINGLVDDILGTPPPVEAYHVELVGIAKVPQLCDLSYVLHQIDQAGQDPLQVMFQYASSQFTSGGVNPRQTTC